MRKPTTDTIVMPTDVVIEEPTPTETVTQPTAQTIEIAQEVDTSQLVTVFDGLSIAQVDALYKPFSITEHEFHPYFNFVYLKEQAINKRLTEVFGNNWSFVPERYDWFEAGESCVKVAGNLMELSKAELSGLISKNPDTGKYNFNELEVVHDIPASIAHGKLTVNGVTRGGIGGDVDVSLGKEPNQRKINTIKASYTDLLKRLARMWGVGLYLTQVGKSVKDANSLRARLHEMFPDDMRFFAPAESAQVLIDSLGAKYPNVYENTEAVKTVMTKLRIPGGQYVIDNWYKVESALIEYAKSA
jgi:hypothetical protein